MTFTFTVTVECETEAQAKQVMAERIYYEEEYYEVDGVPCPEGFVYTIDFKEAQ